MSYIADSIREGGKQVRMICGDAKLRRRIHTIASKKHRRNLADEERERKALLEHPAIYFDALQSAIEQGRRDLAKRGHEMLRQLGRHVDSEKVIYRGIPPSLSGPPVRLTRQKLASRSTQVLPLSDDWLMFALERHPGGTSRTVQNYWQYWAYNLWTHIVEWLDGGVMGSVDVGFRTGAGELDQTLVEDWFRAIEENFGPKIAAEFRKDITLPADDLCDHPTGDARGRCEAVTGIDPAMASAADHGRVVDEFYARGGDPTTYPINSDRGVIIFGNSRLPFKL